MSCQQSTFYQRLSPGVSPGLTFFLSISIIAGGAELTCQADVVDESRVRWFGGLTCDFWAENAEKIFTARVKATKSDTSTTNGQVLLLLLVGTSSVPIDAVDQLPGILAELELKLTLSVDDQLGGRVKTTTPLLFVLIV